MKNKNKRELERLWAEAAAKKRKAAAKKAAASQGETKQPAAPAVKQSTES